MQIKIIAFSGSLRKESYTTKLVKAFKKSAPQCVGLELIDISNLPFINQDLESDLPEPVKNLHQKIRAADAILFATPEYNRSYTPIIKNVIDWGSRPAGKNNWNEKPAAVIGCSPSQLGAFGAVNHLRQVLLYVNVCIMQQPEFYLSQAAKIMDEQGNITDDKTQQLINAFWSAYLKWIGKWRK